MPQMDNQQVPKENIEIFCYLFRIETALRELIIDTLGAIDGPYWYKKRLPGDVLEKCRKGIEYERSTKWSQLVPHHPIYYGDFADLRKIIERQDNWGNVFERVFSRKDILVSTLGELEFIRNKVAHNRKANSIDVEVVVAAYSKLSESIGEDRFDELSMKCTCAEDIFERLHLLKNESEYVYSICSNYDYLDEDNIKVWRSVCNEWWFNESYLSVELENIIVFFH